MISLDALHLRLLQDVDRFRAEAVFADGITGTKQSIHRGHGVERAS